MATPNPEPPKDLLPATIGEASSSEPPKGLPECFTYKNRLQEFTQRSALALPLYQTVHSGAPNDPKFRSTVLVDGTYYTSPVAFSNKKAVEQDVARIAYLGIYEKIKSEACPFVNEYTVLCKSILHEYAAKWNLGSPAYQTSQLQAQAVPVFASTLIIGGTSYTGGPCKSKKEAEQLAARVAILSILESEFGIGMFEIIKSKFKQVSASNKVQNTDNVSTEVGGGNVQASPLNKRKDIEEIGTVDSMVDPSSTVASQSGVGQPAEVLAAHGDLLEFKRPKPEPVFEGAVPITFVAPAVDLSQQNPISRRKKNRRKKKNAKKSMENAQFSVAVVPTPEAISC